ncbi:MAG TPA: crosslink repair DNA glycosylase YcaQ family protein [Acidimicrobiales bacterium]|jgi:hypothetical protein
MRAPAERVSNAAARRIALAAQGFGDPAPSGRIDIRHLRRALGRVGLLQIDSVNVLVRSHELPLFARLGPYPRPALTELIERRHELFEYWAHVASFVPVELYPMLRWRMERAGGHSWRSVAAIVEQHPGYIDAVLAEVAERGPITAAELEDPGAKQGPWWGWAKGKTALEWLFSVGRVTSAGRGRNFERRYDLPERVLPHAVLDAPVPSETDAKRHLVLESARWHGIGTARDLADYFRLGMADTQAALTDLVEAGSVLRVDVESWQQPAYLYAGARRPRRVHARAFLSPFDSLVWARARTERLFGMQYRIELYTPPPKRTYGYYVLPFLLGEELVARVDLKADRKESTLRMIGAHLEPGHSDPSSVALIASELQEELRSMADWLELDRVTPSRVRF